MGWYNMRGYCLSVMGLDDYRMLVVESSQLVKDVLAFSARLGVVVRKTGDALVVGEKVVLLSDLEKPRHKQELLMILMEAYQ